MGPNDTTASYWISRHLLSFLLFLAHRNMLSLLGVEQTKSPSIKHASSLCRTSPLYRQHGTHARPPGCDQLSQVCVALRNHARDHL
ncbi:hypothetical protein BDR05DRAFT_914406 [Suillus weaverae]|nr:hypothetical protein BDR05DRAFT_914406 [Suillus weaverae]